MDITTYVLLTSYNHRITVYVSLTDTSSNIDLLSKLKVTNVICLCNEHVHNEHKIKHIKYDNIIMSDGSPPSKEILEQFNDIIENSTCVNEQLNVNTVVYMHCCNNLSRVAIMLAYLMVAHCKTNRIATIKKIGEKCPNAINMKQIEWLITTYIRLYRRPRLYYHN